MSASEKKQNPDRVEDEAELKIKLSPEDMEKVFQALVQKSGTSDVSHKFRPRAYYDTADLDLYKANLSLRVQYKKGKQGHVGCYEQTVKVGLNQVSSMGKGVLFRRECKDNIKSYEPDLSAVKDPHAQKALASFKGKKLMHIFTAAIERRSFDWKIKNGQDSGTVEVAFDLGQLILPHNNASQDFSEIEVEIKQGSPDFIEVVKNEILRIAPSAQIQTLSKSGQGSQLYLKHKK